MRILVTGATGFLGRHIAFALRLAGHQVRCAVRDALSAAASMPGFEFFEIDFQQAFEANVWLPALSDIDAVINTVGIFTEQEKQTFQALHIDAPCALFSACVSAGVPRAIQISALGAAADSPFNFLRSKQVADEFLLRQPFAAAVLRPAPVFGTGGASARLFSRLATLPVLPLPSVDTTLQPVHIDDICAAVLHLLGNQQCGIIPAVGPQSLSMQAYIATLRRSLGYRAAWVLEIPSGLIVIAGRVFRSAWLQPETQKLLQTSTPADGAVFRTLVGRPLIFPSQFIDKPESFRCQLILSNTLLVLRYSIAILWIITGIISLWIFPRAASIELLNRSGFDSPLAGALLYIAAALDLALGIAIVFLNRWRRQLWLLQAAVIIGYSCIITLRLPEFWAHPYGPILKNLPILAAIALLYSQEPLPRKQRSNHSERVR